VLFLRPYRCRSCRYRAYVFTWRWSPQGAARRSDESAAGEIRGTSIGKSGDLSNSSGTASVPVGGLLIGMREGQHGLLSKVRSTDLHSDRKT
jgi:hypothetical protein